MDNNNKKTILVAGYYGFGNVGDEAILSAILTDLRKQREGLEFIVISSNPEETAASHNVRSVHWKEINALMDAARECDLIILGGGGRGGRGRKTDDDWDKGKTDDWDND